MPHIRRAALVFGSYTWIFALLFLIDLVSIINKMLTREELLFVDNMLFILLSLISIPFLVIKFGRNIWNKLRSTKYKSREAEKDFERWWNKRKEHSGQDINVVYGHTHLIDFWGKNEGSNLPTLLNIPSWIIVTKKNEIALEKVFRHAFLYIDEENCEFIGWDYRQKCPFLIPKQIIIERRENGDLTKLEPEIVEKLQEIGWPRDLVDKWMEYIPI
jgi:hypothetical protein